MAYTILAFQDKVFETSIK